MQEYSSPEEDWYGVSYGYFTLSGFDNPLKNLSHVQLYKVEKNKYATSDEMITITVKAKSVVIKGMVENWYTHEQYSISGTYKLVERFSLP